MKKYPFPSIKTKLPGPKASKIIKSDKIYVSPSYTRDFPCVAEKGNGLILTDIDGNEFLDFCAGIAVCATGHCHPEVVSAIKYQTDKLIHMSGTDFYYEVQTKLAAKLCSIAPGKDKKRVYFANSGAEVIESAIKLVRYKTKRPRLIAYLGAFHGRTMGALSLTGSKVVQKEGFAPLLPGVTHVSYPYCYRCPYGQTYGKCSLECIEYLTEIVFKKIVPPKETAAIFFEPILGEGGYIVPPREYVRELRKITKKHGILLVADEIQSGMGRTGKMFASNHYGLEPDIICLAKGIASGLPLGALIAKADIMNWQYGSHASTFGGNPVSCAASLETINILENRLIDNAEKMGAYLIKKLKQLQKKHKCIGDIRGKGLMVGAEIVTDRRSKKADGSLRNKIVDRAFYNGLIILGCGPNSIRFSPALIVEKEHIDCCLEILDGVIKSITK
ncbi:acetyl ornithine aminotransferase family protein [bacterium]|nr:acetyl ornithine aminotransferase family protein [bacterium]